VYRELNREEEAIAQWRRAVDTDSTFMPALDDLSALLRKRAEWRPAREVYLKILNVASSAMDTSKQSATQRALAVIAEALGEQAADLYLKRGEILAERLDEPARAVDAYAAALAARPTVDTRFRLADALARSGRWREAAAERSKLADQEEEVPVRIEHLLVLAE